MGIFKHQLFVWLLNTVQFFHIFFSNFLKFLKEEKSNNIFDQETNGHFNPSLKKERLLLTTISFSSQDLCSKISKKHIWQSNSGPNSLDPMCTGFKSSYVEALHKVEHRNFKIFCKFLVHFHIHTHIQKKKISSLLFLSNNYFLFLNRNHTSIRGFSICKKTIFCQNSKGLNK